MRFTLETIRAAAVKASINFYPASQTDSTPVFEIYLPELVEMINNLVDPPEDIEEELENYIGRHGSLDHMLNMCDEEYERVKDQS